jgi:outer membrane immunogenic protein
LRFHAKVLLGTAYFHAAARSRCDVGVNVGGGQSIVNAPEAATFTTINKTQLNGTGFAGGGQIGYNFTGIFTPKLFVGVEADFGALQIRAKMTDWFDQNFIFTADTDWYATARARFGLTTGPALLYFTAGGAWVHLSTGFTPNVATPNAQLFSKTAGGWTFGGGTEVALDPRWSVRLEALYIDVGHDVASINTAMPLFGADFRNRFQVVRFGLNYKLGGDKLAWTRN